MKKLILIGSALLLSLGAANAQGFSTTGGLDDFTTSTQYANGLGQGLYWFDLTEGDTLAVTRPGDGALHVTATNAGGCTTANMTDCYPAFGVEFGSGNELDLSTFADIRLDIENTSTTDFLYIDVKLVDYNNVQSEYEPNVSDLSPSSTWGDPERKSLNGFTLLEEERKTITIDLSSVPGAIGGLSPSGAHDCAPGPYNCPPTTYQINPARIKSVLFRVNFGKSNIFLSEGADYTADTFLEGSGISSYTGVIKIYEFEVGNFVSGTRDAAVENTLSVYPNPADDALNVSFDATADATVSLTDLMGNTVYTTSATAGANKIKVNTSDLSTGLYILNVATEKGMVARKVTIK